MRDVDLDTHGAVEALMVKLGILDTVLEVDAIVLVLVATQVGQGTFTVPEQVLV